MGNSQQRYGSLLKKTLSLIRGGRGGGGKRETTCKRWRPGGGGFGLVRVAIACLKVRKTAAAFKPSRHTTRNHVKFRRDRVLQMHMFPCMYVGTVEVTTFCMIFVDPAENASSRVQTKTTPSAECKLYEEYVWWCASNIRVLSVHKIL